MTVLLVTVLALSTTVFAVSFVLEARGRSAAEAELKRLDREIEQADGLTVRCGAKLHRFDTPDVEQSWFYRSTLSGSATGVKGMAIGSFTTLSNSYLELDEPLRRIGRDTRIMGVQFKGPGHFAMPKDAQ